MEAPKVEKPKEVRTDVDQSISTYNGAATDKYNWSQQINNVDL